MSPPTTSAPATPPRRTPKTPRPRRSTRTGAASSPVSAPRWPPAATSCGPGGCTARTGATSSPPCFGWPPSGTPLTSSPTSGASPRGRTPSRSGWSSWATRRGPALPRRAPTTAPPPVRPPGTTSPARSSPRLGSTWRGSGPPPATGSSGRRGVRRTGPRAVGEGRAEPARPLAGHAHRGARPANLRRARYGRPPRSRPPRSRWPPDPVKAARLAGVFGATARVAAGMAVLGLAGYVYLAVLHHHLRSSDVSALTNLYLLVNIIGPGLFVTLEQETGRLMSVRIARDEGTRDTVARMARIGLVLLVGVVAVLGLLEPVLVPLVLGGRLVLYLLVLFAAGGYAAVYVCG